MKFGVQLWSLREIGEKEGTEAVLKAVADAGYDGVEFAGFYGTAPDEMKALLQKYDLVPMSAHIGAWAIEENLPFIDALGIRYVFIPWEGPETFADPEKYAALLEQTAKMKKLMDERGIVFGYHNHAHEYENGCDSLFRFTSDADIKAELDVFWATVAGKNAVEEMKRLKGRLACVHIKEAAAENPRENPQPVVGEGCVGMEGVFAEAKAQGIEWCFLEVEQYPCEVGEYLSRSLANMKKLAK